MCACVCAKGCVFISLRRFPPSFQSLKTSYLPVNVCRWSRYYQSPSSTIFKRETHAQVHSAARTRKHMHTHELGVLHRPSGLSIFPEVDISSHDRPSENISFQNLSKYASTPLKATMNRTALDACLPILKI